jgi:hypothetical protein
MLEVGATGKRERELEIGTLQFVFSADFRVSMDS